YYPFLLADITIITLFFGIFVPLFKNKNKVTSETYKMVVSDKIYSKHILIIIVFSILLHSTGTVCALFTQTKADYMFYIVASSIVYLALFSHICNIYFKESYDKKLFNLISKFAKMSHKDRMKKEISILRKNEYENIARDISNLIPSVKEDFDKLASEKIRFLIVIFIFTFDLESRYSFLYERHNLFKRVDNQKFLISEKHYFFSGENFERNDFSRVMKLKVEKLLGICETEETEIFLNQMLIPNNYRMVSSNSNSSSSIIELLTKIRVKNKGVLHSTMATFINKQINEANITLRGEKRGIGNAKKFILKHDRICGDFYSWNEKLKNDKKQTGIFAKDTLWERLMLQHSFQVIRMFRKIFDTLQKYSMNEPTHPIHLLNLNVIKEQIQIFKKLCFKYPKLDNITNHYWTNKFLNGVKNRIEKEEQGMEVSTYAMKGFDNEDIKIFNLLFERIINNNNNNNDAINLWRKIFSYVKDQQQEKIKDSRLFTRGYNKFNLTNAWMYKEFVLITKLCLILYDIKSKEFLEVLNTITSNQVEISLYTSNNFDSREKLLKKNYNIKKINTTWGEYFYFMNEEKEEILNDKREYEKNNH
ncbi:hypothetical protein, partial [Mycoplasma marinum]